MEEDEAETQRAFFPKTSAEHHPILKEDRRVYERMVELLRNSEYEGQDRRPERMALSQNPNVSMENVEETEGKDALFDETGSAQRAGIYDSKLSQRILVDNQYRGSQYGTYKRKTDKQRFL